MALEISFLIAGVLGLFYYVWQYYQSIAKYPRGPTPLPFIGNLYQLNPTKLGETFARMARQYGSVYTVHLPVPIVVLSDYESLKEAFITKGDDFSGRPILPFNLDLQFCANPGVINSNGESWRENRRHSISILRDFGMGKGLMEEKVTLSIIEFLRYLDQIEDKKHVDLRWPIQVMVGNIINEVLFGFRYKYDDCGALVHYVDSFRQLIIKLSTSKLRFVAAHIPWIRHVPLVRHYAVDQYRGDMKELHDFIERQVKRSLETYNADAEAECFVHAYAQRIPTSEWLNDLQLMATSADFFNAGQETTTTTLRWATLLLAANQDVQERIRTEIHSVIGKDRMPAMADRPLLPYTCAAVYEVQRRANILETNIIHRTLVDTEVMGHKIPKNTLVNGNIHYIMAQDPIFEDPKAFRPERYLLSDGKTFNKDAVERTVPFSIGKRQCAGEALARVELFLGLAAIVQHYRILPSDDGPIDLSYKPRIFLTPKRQRLCLEKLT